SDEVKQGLRPGMSATAEITTNVAKDVLAVPLEAVIEKRPEGSPSPEVPAANNGAEPIDTPKSITGGYVLVNGKAEFREVETGLIGESDREIKSGLQAGDVVITGPSRVLNTLKDGTAVQKEDKPSGQATKS